MPLTAGRFRRHAVGIAVVLGLVVIGQALILGSWLRRALGGPRHLGDTVWFYLAGSGALLSGIGLAVIGTLFTLWPSVLRTRIVPGIAVAARWALLLCVGGLAAIISPVSAALSRQRVRGRSGRGRACG